MEDEEKTEDSENTSEEEEQTSEKSEEENTPDWKAKSDAMYAKFKEEQEARKKLEEKLNKLSKKPEGEVDIEAIASQLSAVQGLDATERGRLIKEAKIQGISLEEARKSEDFKFWRSAYRAKIEKNKAPKPSTKQSAGEEKDLSKIYKKASSGELSTEEAMAFASGLYGMSDKEREEFLISIGAVSPRYANYSRPDKSIPGIRKSGPIKKTNRLRYKKVL